MAYVDLNPIRAKIADTPETSAYTSIKQRISEAVKGKQPQSLMPFSSTSKNELCNNIEFDLKDYLTLVDTTGRAIREDKKGYISSKEEKILKKLKISAETWELLVSNFSRIFHGPIGTERELAKYYNHNNQTSFHKGNCKLLSN